MGYGQHSKSGYPTRADGVTTPPIPAATNSVLIASMWNWRPVEYPSLSSVSIDGNDYHFLGTAPYPTDWTAVSANPDPPPYLLSAFYDQLGLNDLTQSGAARPTLDTAVKSPLGAAGCGLAGGARLYGSGFATAGTIYCSFKGNDDGFLFSTADGSGADGQIIVKLLAGTVSADLYGNTGNRQTKTKAIADSSWHWLAVTFDTTLAAANQLVVEIDDSTTGVVATNTQDLASQNIAGGSGDLPSVFCKDAGGVPANAYTGYINTVIANSVADAAALRTSYFKRWQFLMSTIGVTV